MALSWKVTVGYGNSYAALRPEALTALPYKIQRSNPVPSGNLIGEVTVSSTHFSRSGAYYTLGHESHSSLLPEVIATVVTAGHMNWSAC